MSDHSPAFERYIGIDYSGAQTPDQSLKGLRAYAADRSSSPVEVPPPPSPRKYWTRKGLAQWLVEIFREDVSIIVGIDHSFSFPIRYFETHHILPDWQTFLDDFQAHWPTDRDHTYVGSCQERQLRQRRKTMGKNPLKTAHGGAGRGKICFSLRRSRLGRQVYPRRVALVAISAPGSR